MAESYQNAGHAASRNVATSNYSNMPYATSDIREPVFKGGATLGSQNSATTLSSFEQCGDSHSTLPRSQYPSTTLSSFMERYPLHGQRAPNHPSDGKYCEATKSSRKDHRRQRTGLDFGPFNSNLHGGTHYLNLTPQNNRQPSQYYGPDPQIHAAQHSTAMAIRDHKPTYVDRPIQTQTQEYFNRGFDPNNANLDPFRQRQLPSGQARNVFPNTHGAVAHTPAPLIPSSATVGRPIQPPHPALLPYDMFDPGWRISSQLHRKIMSNRDPRLPPSPLRHPWNIGPPVYMAIEQYQATLEWNNLHPLTPDYRNGIPNYYSGPIHYTTAGEPIMMFADFGKRTHDETMLPPYVLPLNCFLPDTCKENIHIIECQRHKDLMEEVLAVPKQPGLPGNPISWFRIMGDMRRRSKMVAWHPHVIDLFGHISLYQDLLELDINGRNNNEKGVGRNNSPRRLPNTQTSTLRFNRNSQSQSQNAATEPKLTQMTASESALNQAQIATCAAPNPSKEVGMKVHKTTMIKVAATSPSKEAKKAKITEVNTVSQKQTVTMHTRDNSDETSILSQDDSKLAERRKLQYLGYSLRGEKYHPEKFRTPSNRGTHFDGSKLLTESDMNPKVSPEVSPTMGGTRRGTKSASTATPLLDFDRDWSDKKGEDRDVDFALRDKGPPRFDGKTFNEAINYTPDPRERPHSAGPITYGVLFGYRGPRD